MRTHILNAIIGGAIGALLYRLGAAIDTPEFWYMIILSCSLVINNASR